MWVRRAAVTIAICGSLALAASAMAANPAKNTRFRGTATGTVRFATSFTAKDPLAFSTVGSTSILEGFMYTDTACGLASSKVVDVGTVRVRHGGTFSVSGAKSGPANDATEDGGKVYTTTTISGKFTSAHTATGTLEYTQRVTGATPASCGPIKLKFTATGS